MCITINSVVEFYSALKKENGNKTLAFLILNKGTTLSQIEGNWSSVFGKGKEKTQRFLLIIGGMIKCCNLFRNNWSFMVGNWREREKQWYLLIFMIFFQIVHHLDLIRMNSRIYLWNNLEKNSQVNIKISYYGNTTKSISRLCLVSNQVM